MKSKEMEWEVFIQTSTLEDSVDPILDEDDEKGKEEWIKIKDKIRNYEISIIRKGNKHGHKSWGWDNMRGDIKDKTILFTENQNNLGMDKDDCIPNKRLDWGKDMAQKFCDVLNSFE